ncbi:MAG: hypothetical protein HYT81_10230 [Gemmatimonadetes bacterium]|nr:hypothetical protein [Gemmatimonadota bacterium]
MAAIAGLVAVFVGLARGQALVAFLGSSAWLAGMLVATASNTAAGLRTALGWWAVGFPIAAAYFVVLFRIHRGKAVAARDGEGY